MVDKIKLSVRSIRPTGRWRCGRKWDASWNEAEVTVEEAARLRADPFLQVSTPEEREANLLGNELVTTQARLDDLNRGMEKLETEADTMRRELRAAKKRAAKADTRVRELEAELEASRARIAEVEALLAAAAKNADPPKAPKGAPAPKG